MKVTIMGIHERPGKSGTNRGMEQSGDLLTILYNLWNETYQKGISHDIGILVLFWSHL
ncbi:MAG: hypothetical protein ACT6FD_01795 [Methanosarcinaceae archaeon]